MVINTFIFSVLLVSLVCIESFKVTFPAVQRHHKMLSLKSSYMISKEKIIIQKSTKLFFKGLIAPVDTTKAPSKSPLKQLVIILKSFWKFTFLALFRVLLAPFGFIVGKIFTSKSKYLEEEEEEIEANEEIDDVPPPQVTEVDRNFLKAKELAALKLKESKSIAVAKKAVQKRLLEIEKKSPTTKMQSAVVASPPKAEAVSIQYPKIVTESPVVSFSSVGTMVETVIKSEPTIVVNSLATTETEVSPIATAESFVVSKSVEETSPVFEVASPSPIVEEIAVITNKNIAVITTNELEIQQVTQSIQDNVAMEAPAITSLPTAVASTESVSAAVMEYEVLADSVPVTKPVAIADITSLTAESIKTTLETVSAPITQTLSEPSSSASTVTQTKGDTEEVQLQTQTDPQRIISGPYDPNAVMNNLSGEDYLSSVLPQSVKELNDRIKSAGVSGTVAYVGVEVMFWAASVPLAVTSYHTTTGAWLSLTDPYDQGKILALTTTFAAAARIAVPFRLAAAVALMPWVEKNIVNNAFFSGANSTSVSEANDLPINES